MQNTLRTSPVKEKHLNSPDEKTHFSMELWYLHKTHLHTHTHAHTLPRTHTNRIEWATVCSQMRFSIVCQTKLPSIRCVWRRPIVTSKAQLQLVLIEGPGVCLCVCVSASKRSGDWRRLSVCMCLLVNWMCCRPELCVCVRGTRCAPEADCVCVQVSRCVWCEVSHTRFHTHTQTQRSSDLFQAINSKRQHLRAPMRLNSQVDEMKQRTTTQHKGTQWTK